VASLKKGKVSALLWEKRAKLKLEKRHSGSYWIMDLSGAALAAKS